MLGPTAAFASAGQQEEGLTQCSKGATIYQAGSRQAGRGRGLRWLGIPGTADAGCGCPRKGLAVLTPPLAWGSLWWSCQSLNLLLWQVALYVGTHRRQIFWVGWASCRMQASPCLPIPPMAVALALPPCHVLWLQQKTYTVVLWKECGTRNTGIC